MTRAIAATCRARLSRYLGIRTSSGHGRRGGGGREELISEFGYDTKYAMHCARLGFRFSGAARHGRNWNFQMQGEPAEWLLRVRRGEVPFEEWWERARSLWMLCSRSSKATLGCLPPASRSGIERWMIEAHLAFWAARVWLPKA